LERSQKTAKTSVKIADNPTRKQLSPQELSLEHHRYSNLLCFKKLMNRKKFFSLFISISKAKENLFASYHAPFP
jgi:hypothetical protein